MGLTTERSPKRRQQIILLLCLLLALFVTLFLGTRAFRRFLHRPTDEPIREWMNVPYVAHSYQIPPHILFHALNLNDAPPPDKRPIRRIARELGMSVEQVTKILEDAIAKERATQWLPGEPPPPPPPPPPTVTPVAATSIATPTN